MSLSITLGAFAVRVSWSVWALDFDLSSPNALLLLWNLSPFVVVALLAFAGIGSVAVVATAAMAAGGAVAFAWLTASDAFLNAAAVFAAPMVTGLLSFVVLGLAANDD